MKPAPRVSVLIATYNRARLLDECLRHLAVQRLGPGDEVIVIDNGSTDDTRQVVERHQPDFPAPLHLLFEPEAGKSRAIARGLAAAQGDILAFTDDDVNVGPRWLEAIRNAMDGTGVALVGGRVEPRWDDAVPSWMRRAPARRPRLGAPLGLLDYGRGTAALGRRTALGANLAVRREVFASVGGYAAHLGKLRGTLLSGEDHELCRRVQAAGHRAIYLPAAVVHHWVPADRARVGYFLTWFYWSGITNAVMDRDGGVGGRGLRGVPLYLLRRALVSAAWLVAHLVVGRRSAALDRAVDLAYAAGYAAERWRGSPRAAWAAPRATGGAL